MEPYASAERPVTEHWGDRDDLGQANQLEWVPPTPGCLIRRAPAERQAMRAEPGRDGVRPG